MQFCFSYSAAEVSSILVCEYSSTRLGEQISMHTSNDLGLCKNSDYLLD